MRGPPASEVSSSFHLVIPLPSVLAFKVTMLTSLNPAGGGGIASTLTEKAICRL